jgi:hypothetical protein
MLRVLVGRNVRGLWALTALICVFALLAERRALAQSAEAAIVRPASVDAHYRIQWLGAHIGDFKFKSTVANQKYELRATADVSVFFGAVTWKGVTESAGYLSPSGPSPSSYKFRFRTGEKRENVEMRFAQRMVRDISIEPVFRPSSRRVPITESHLRNVVDPLSAAILVSQSGTARNGEQACNRRVPIFDGKLRYDLVFSFKTTRSVEKRGSIGGTAYVCRVRYVPVAGHKPSKDDDDYITDNSGIEVWLVPMPEANLMVPYYVTIPTPAGAASMIAAKFDVDMRGDRS